MNAFHKIQLSPIAIQSTGIPYMQSIESLLEFKNPGTNEIKYFDMIKSRSRGKEMFCYGGNNY